jgi:hypothetical protein
MAAFWPEYARRQKRGDREIPVVIIDRLARLSRARTRRLDRRSSGRPILGTMGAPVFRHRNNAC